MPRRNRNVDTVRQQPAPKRTHSNSMHAKSRKPSVKRLRFRVYGGEL